MKGKRKCRILKEIRKKIADANGIEYAVSECKHKGDCLGTCPKCESELRYLESELEKKRIFGKKVAVMGVALGVALGSSACSEPMTDGGETGGDPLPPIQDELSGDLADVPVTKGEIEDTVETPGELPFEEEELVGELDVPEEEIMGNVPVDEP